MRTAARYAIELVIILLGILLHGVWLVVDVVMILLRRAKPEVVATYADNCGLDSNDADGRPQDGIREALLRIFKPGELLRRRFWHDLKNAPFEWFRKNPKAAVRVCGALILLWWLL